MNDTPRTYARVRQMIDNNVSPEGLEYFARDLERELNSANTIIRQQQLLNEENLRLQERIKRLEDIISRAKNKFFRHGSNGTAASGMLDILGEVRKP